MSPISSQFQSALAAPKLPFCVLHVFGPGGVGKTFLLRQFAGLAERAGTTTLYIDGRNIELTPGGLLGALRTAALAADPQAGLPEGSDASEIWKALNTREKRCVMLIDTYETLAPLDGWLRDARRVASYFAEDYVGDDVTVAG